MYGATGHDEPHDDRRARSRVYRLGDSPLLLAGIALLLVGFGFKVADGAVPHVGARRLRRRADADHRRTWPPTVKAAAFAAFLRVWLEAFPARLRAVASGASAGSPIATMVVGNAIALAQKNLKRLLAYSSIAHAGYLLVAIAAGTLQGSSALLFYLFAYTLATFGAFAVDRRADARRRASRDDRRPRRPVERAARGSPSR